MGGASRDSTGLGALEEGTCQTVWVMSCLETGGEQGGTESRYAFLERSLRGPIRALESSENDIITSVTHLWYNLSCKRRGT